MKICHYLNLYFGFFVSLNPIANFLKNASFLNCFKILNHLINAVFRISFEDDNFEISRFSPLIISFPEIDPSQNLSQKIKIMFLVNS